MLLRHLLDEGLKKTDITARLGVSRGLIYHWLRTGQLGREVDELPRPGPVLSGRPSSRRTKPSLMPGSRRTPS